MKLLTESLLCQIFPHATNSPLNVREIVIQLRVALNSLIGDEDFGVKGLYRQAAFLAQTGHESGDFRAVKENLNYSKTGLRTVFRKYFPTDELAEQYARQPVKIANRVYANRMGNRDEASGDGWRYRGRGLIQLTGKDNYVACGTDLGVDLAVQPEWLESPEGAVKSALWYWNKNSLNTYADVEDIRGMTKRINGGYNGLDDRIQKYEKAKQVLSTGV
jgi:putative chitinase